MMREKCRACKYYSLVYSPVYKSYIEDCTYTGDCRKDGCKDAYEPRKETNDDRETKGDA